MVRRNLLIIGVIIVIVIAAVGGYIALTPSLTTQREQEVSSIRILGGLSGGGGYQFSVALSNLMSKYMPGVAVTVEATQGFVDNAVKLHAGVGDMGIVSTSEILKILNREAPFDSPGKKVYVVLPLLPPTYFHILVPADSPIKSFSDLSGKRVSVLTRGSLTESLANQIFQALGINIQPVYLTHTDAAIALSRGEIDAAATTTFASQYKELALSKKLRVLSLTPEEVSTLTKKLPFISIEEYDFGKQYEGANKASVPVVWTSLVAREDLPEAFVYRFVKLVFEHISELASSYPPAGELKPETLLKSPTPLHPGVVRYLQEIGTKVPENLMPKK